MEEPILKDEVEEEEEKEKKLYEFADTVSSNKNGEYYCLSFQFKKIKSRTNSKKKEQQESINKP